MAKRNKKQNRQKENIKKRNFQRIARKSDQPSGDKGLSLADAGVKDLYEILLWSSGLTGEAEFEAPIFNPGECIEAFGRQSEALGLGESENLSKEELDIKQSDLMIATVEEVLTKKHQKEIVRRLKKIKKRFEAEGLTQFVTRIQILLSLVEFTKDDRVWGTIGLVSSMVMKNVQDVMLLTTTAQDAMAADQIGGENYGELIESLEKSPQRQLLDEMVEKNPALGEYYKKKLEDAWQEGMMAVEQGELSLMLFDPADYEAVDTFLEQAKVSPDSDELDHEKAPIFIDNVSNLVNEKMNSAEFLQRAKNRLEEIAVKESVPAEYLSFVLAMRDAFDQPKWVEESAGFVMLRSLFADLRAPSQ
ncbi:MAG: hypothetical protein ACI9EW_001233 [Cellvibrionaceae bacterium]|jgi:hypothetical protein